MTWDPSTSLGYESAKIASIAVPYLQGRGLDVGCGMNLVWPSAIGVDSKKAFGPHTAASVESEGDDLSMFADATMDYVFSSHTLEHFESEKVPAVLAEWWRVLKVGGRLVLYLPHADFYPNIGQPGANPDHKADYVPQDIINLMKSVGSWTMLEDEARNAANEYSFFQVFRKEADGAGHTFDLWQRYPRGKKRACVCRFGAIGDQIIAASILPALKKQGYFITYMTTPDAQQIVMHDPNIDEFWIQARDFVPNNQLGPFWESIKERFDHFVNLCESIEGSLLKIAGRLDHGYSDETRRRLYGKVNYLERTHDIASVPHDFAPRFYTTAEERRIAQARMANMQGPVIAWAVAGSSMHKLYPHIPAVVGWLLDKTDASIVLLGDAKEGLDIQNAIIHNVGEHRRLFGMAGQWKIREVLTFVQQADIVVGPETGVMNAVCFEPNAKVVYLSHSSRHNLTLHWRNTMALEPARTPCYPCHRLHHDGTFCHKDEATQAALCAANVEPERLYKAIELSLLQVKRRMAQAAD